MLEEMEEKIDDLIYRSELQELRINDINSKLDLLLSKTYPGSNRHTMPPAPQDRRAKILTMLFKGG